MVIFTALLCIWLVRDNKYCIDIIIFQQRIVPWLLFYIFPLLFLLILITALSLRFFLQDARWPRLTKDQVMADCTLDTLKRSANITFSATATLRTCDSHL